METEDDEILFMGVDVTTNVGSVARALSQELSYEQLIMFIGLIGKVTVADPVFTNMLEAEVKSW